MSIETKSDLIVSEVVNSIIEQHGARQDEIIPILTDINQTLGYVPKEAMEIVSVKLRVPKSQLFSVASFYSMLATKVRGQHVIQFCESAPCHVVGGRQVWEALQEALNGLESGETSPDGKWTLSTTSCLGVCGVGPVIIVDEDMYGNVQPGQIPEILARYH